VCVCARACGSATGLTAGSGQHHRVSVCCEDLIFFVPSRKTKAQICLLNIRKSAAK